VPAGLLAFTLTPTLTPTLYFGYEASSLFEYERGVKLSATASFGMQWSEERGLFCIDDNVIVWLFSLFLNRRAGTNCKFQQ
jgi:hypothetical protein